MKISDALSQSDASKVSVKPGVTIWVYQPPDVEGTRPALLWMHAGGMVAGNARQNNAFFVRIAEELGVVVATVEYRLAPEHPFPTPLEDCYAAFRWLIRQPDIDTERIAVGGASAGGGLATALCLLAKERGEKNPLFQLLVYPMLDDRTALRTDLDESCFRIWDNASNLFGWQSYLGDAFPDDVPVLAAPARHKDLKGLPPAWIGVGTHDLFYDENIAYANRLQREGVCCTLEVIPGAYHGFDQIESKAPISRDFVDAQIRALAKVYNSDA